jgi:hypothetical protein
MENVVGRSKEVRRSNQSRIFHAPTGKSRKRGKCRKIGQNGPDFGPKSADLG